MNMETNELDKSDLIDGYKLTVGLEVHAELNTDTKMFCSCANDPEAPEPNTNICPICMAHPGTIPTINKKAVHQVLRVGTAIGAKLADYTEFDRKSYFYPDSPKGYQISQFEHPFVAGGSLVGINVTRIHLEEDTARSSHISADDTTDASSKGKSLVDFNRAGVPLMELVTEPDIHDAATAGKFARELQLLLRTLGASNANLEKGEMRVEANISISKTDELGTKVEVKNLNSFRSVERAIAYEVERQAKLIEEGGTVVQETRGWDENKNITFSQRVKEGSADYRYFPEPDLPKMIVSQISEFSQEALEASLPELPWERRARYSELGLKEGDVAYLGATRERGVFFDAVLEILNTDASLANENSVTKKAALITTAVNYIVSDLGGFYANRANSDSPEFELVTPSAFTELITMISANELSSRGAKDVLAVMAAEGGNPKDIAEKKGLLQVSDPEALRTQVKEIIAANPTVIEEYRAGKDSVLMFLVGQGMKATKGAGNPEMIRTLLVEELSK
jgi:aspartyl-tRNA(Asn)/glutamyl-tRNA(Gln) amidotransferase subunit B